MNGILNDSFSSPTSPVLPAVVTKCEIDIEWRSVSTAEGASGHFG